MEVNEWHSFDTPPYDGERIEVLMYDGIWMMNWKHGPVPKMMQGWRPFLEANDSDEMPDISVKKGVNKNKRKSSE